MIERMQNLIDRLKVQRDNLDTMIAALEVIYAQSQLEPKLQRRGRRGRKSMGMAEREIVRERMRLYWAQRRAREAEAMGARS